MYLETVSLIFQFPYIICDHLKCVSRLSASLYNRHLGVPHGFSQIKSKISLCGRCDENKLYRVGVQSGYNSAVVQVSFC